MKHLNYKNKKINGTIALTPSKSITNRVQIIKALSNKNFEIKNESTSNDSKILKQILSAYRSNPAAKHVFDVGPAGTAMRFLTSYFASRNSELILTGSSRMKERPIKELVDALREMGATIDYVEREGYPPLKINGKSLLGGKIKIRGDISSQFITSLLLIAPTLKNGLELNLIEPVVSKPYLYMTVDLMKYFGVMVKWEGTVITIPQQEYKEKDISIEADWSAASYWYLVCLLSSHCTLEINGLQQQSLQGDSILVELFDELGVKTTYKKDAILITKRPNAVIPEHFNLDFNNCPDIAQTLAVAIAALKKTALFTGLSTLKTKETDRIVALQNELKKFNVYTESTSDTLRIDARNFKHLPQVIINTYHDHRMAMAFAPLGLVVGDIVIENPDVVNKSYPEFWNDLKTICNV